LTDVREIFEPSGRDMGLPCAKEIMSISSAVWAQCMNVTHRQTEHGTVTSTTIGEIAFRDVA